MKLFRNLETLAWSAWLGVALLSLNSPRVIAAEKSSAASVDVDPASLPPPKRIVLPKLRGELAVDGELNEAVWSRAAMLGPFIVSREGKPEREPTQVRVWYDDRALYLGWTCTDTDIQATFTARDSRFWEEEVAEFFITKNDLARYFELQWNPLGGVFDAIIRNTLDARGVSREFKGDWSYTASGMRSAVKVRGTAGKPGDKDHSWQIEVVVSFADLGEAPPKVGDVWRANFYRFSRGQGVAEQAVAWSPTRLPGFHQPSRFGYLEFGK